MSPAKIGMRRFQPFSFARQCLKIIVSINNGRTDELHRHGTDEKASQGEKKVEDLITVLEIKEHKMT